MWAVGSQPQHVCVFVCVCGWVGDSCARHMCKTSCVDKFQRCAILPMVVNFNLYTTQF